MSGRRKAKTAVPLARDEGWWLHPAFRGEQALPLDGSAAGALPHRWVRSDARPDHVESNVEDDSMYADLSRLLYRLNGHRPGPVRGFYVIVECARGRYAVGQLCADPATPVQLFEDLVYSREDEARAKAADLRASHAGTAVGPARADPRATERRCGRR